MKEKWVQIWGLAPSQLSHFYYPSDKKTYRFVINSALSGDFIRIRLSDELSENQVKIGEITVSSCDENGCLQGELKNICFNGKESFVINAGERILCDAADFSVDAGGFLAVSIYVEEGDLRSGNLLNNAKLFTAKGNLSREKYFDNERRVRDTVIDVSGKILNLALHKPLPLIESVEILNHTDAAAITVFGDSLCQQGFWTNRFELRIRQHFPGKYSVINKSIMGNRLLRDFSTRFPCKGLFGASGKNRLQRDVLDFPDTEFVIVALGINDLLQHGTIAAPEKEKPTAEELLRGVLEISCHLKTYGKKPIVFNVPMFGECIDSRKEKEIMTEEYNLLLEDHKSDFYYLFNQCDIVRNPVKPYCTKKEFLGKDFLHYNQLGGNIIADSIPLNLFE